jgi:hypothetical protein
MFCNTVLGTASFTNPPAAGSAGALNLVIGQPYTIEWEGANSNSGNDYSELSLGLNMLATGNIFWLICAYLFLYYVPC